MYWCDEHKQDALFCARFHSQFPEVKVQDQMSFGDFETIFSIIEKATEKDIEDIKGMLENRRGVLALLKQKNMMLEDKKNETK